MEALPEIIATRGADAWMRDTNHARQTRDIDPMLC